MSVLKYRYFVCRSSLVQRYIQNISLFLVFVIAFALEVKSQNLQWSNPIKLKGPAVFTKVLGENEHGVFIMRYRNRFYSKNIILEKYSHLLALKEGKSVELRNARLMKVILSDKGILLIKSKYMKSRKQNDLIGQWYDFNLKAVSSPKVIASTDSKEFGDRGNYRLRASDDRKTISLLYTDETDTGNIVFHHRLLNDKLETLSSKDVELPYANDLFNINDFMVTNSGVVDFVCAIVDKKRKRILSTEARLFRIENDQVSDYIISKDRVIKTSKLVYDRPNDRATLTGFFGSQAEYGIEGSFFYHVDSSNKPQMISGRFGNSFISAVNINRKAEEKLAEGFEILKAVPRSDGGILLIAEQKDIATEDDIIMVNGIPQSTSKNIFNFNELLLINYDSAGFMDWYKVVTKNQTTVNDGGYFSSVVIYVGEKYIQLLYNDQLRSTGDVMKYTLYNNGREESSKLLKTQMESVAVVPSESAQVASNKIIIPTSKNRRFALLKLQY